MMCIFQDPDAPATVTVFGPPMATAVHTWYPVTPESCAVHTSPALELMVSAPPDCTTQTRMFPATLGRL